MDDLRELYQELIMDHNRSPRHFHKMEDPTRAVRGNNPLCGDDYTIFVKVNDGVLDDVSFTGHGCAISKSSASVMCSFLKGKTIDEAESFFQMFHTMLAGNGDKSPQMPTKLAAFAGVRQYPVRIKCATLAWHGLHTALCIGNGEVTTEDG